MTAIKGHVCFGSEGHVPRDNGIVVKQSSPGHAQIHLGFLQYHHTYSVCVEIPKCYFMGYNREAILHAAEASPPNVNCKLVSILENEDMFDLTLEFHAEKERLVKEEVKFIVDQNTVLRLEFNARVLGPGKGTPLLKNGIRCIGVVRDEMSEASDWQD